MAGAPAQAAPKKVLGSVCLDIRLSNAIFVFDFSCNSFQTAIIEPNSPTLTPKSASHVTVSTMTLMEGVCKHVPSLQDKTFNALKEISNLSGMYMAPEQH